MIILIIYLIKPVGEKIKVSTKNEIKDESNNKTVYPNIIKGPSGKVDKYKGLWLPFLREIKIAADEIEDLKKDGINVVAIGVRLLSKDERVDPEIPNITIVEYENETEILSAINTFHKNNIKIIIILNPAHGDFGISPYPNEFNEGELLEAINPTVIKWAKISEQYGVDMFCPVNEPALLDGRENISKWSQEILKEIKNVYNGKIAFRVHNEGDDYPIYNLTGYDYVLPFSTHCSKDIDIGGGYLDNMKKNNINKIEKIKEKYPNYKYIFFEVSGYTGPNYEP
jgi:hypothetical protein